MMHIINDYYVTTDNYNWILCKKHIVTEEEASIRKKAKAGDIEYRHVSYHASLENLLIKIFTVYKKEIASQSVNIKEYIKELEYMQKDFIKQIKNIEVKDNVTN